MGFIDLESQPVIKAAPGVELRTPHGENIMLSRVELEPGGEVPLHSHPHEQAGMVIQGTLTLTIGDETRELGPGEMYIIPGNHPHRALAQHGPVSVLDIFCPIREDYAQAKNAFFGQP